MAVQSWIKEQLDRHGVDYEEHQHRTVFTAQEVAGEEHVTGYHVAKVVVAFADGKPVLLVLPATHQVAFDVGAARLGVKELRLASEQEMSENFPDCEVGAVPPLPHWDGVDIWMDRSMEHFGEFLFQAGTHEDTILMDFKDWQAMAKPKTATFAHLASARGREGSEA